MIGFIQNSAWGWIYRNVYPLVGQNSASDVFMAAVFGSIMYFPILTEVPFTKALLKDNIIAVGPALALLINGPGVSLPGAILIGRVFGWKKAVLYEALEMLLGGTVGLLFGKIHGDYTCPCQTGPVETFLEEPSSMAAAFILLLCIGFACCRVRALERKRATVVSRFPRSVPVASRPQPEKTRMKHWPTLPHALRPKPWTLCHGNGTGSDQDDRCLPWKWDWLRTRRSRACPVCTASDVLAHRRRAAAGGLWPETCRGRADQRASEQQQYDYPLCALRYAGSHDESAPQVRIAPGQAGGEDRE